MKDFIKTMSKTTDFPYGIYTFRIHLKNSYPWVNVDDEEIEDTWDCADDYTEEQWQYLSEIERESIVFEKQQEFHNSVYYTSYSVNEYDD